MSKLLRNQNLPLPRLEMSWHRTTDDDFNDWECQYELVLGLHKHDIRREDENGEPVYSAMRLSLGGCLSSREGRSPVCQERGTIDTPYRDGAHAQWDSVHLGGIPVFVTCDNVAMRVTVQHRQNDG